MENDIEKHWNVFKFTCGFLQDSTLFIEKTCSAICDIIVRKSKSQSSIVRRNLRTASHPFLLMDFLCLDDLNRERSSISISPFNNAVVCSLLGETTTLHQNRSLYFINGLNKQNIVDVAPLLPASSNIIPCTIILTVGLDTDVSVALETCSKIRQPIQYLEIRGPGRSIPKQNLHPSEKWHLTFSNQTAMNFSLFCDLLAIQDSISCCAGITHMAIYHCFIPDHFFDQLKKNTEMTHLAVIFRNNGCASEVPTKTLCKQLKYLRKLEYLELSRIYLQDGLSAAVEADTFSHLTNLRKLSLRACCLSSCLVLKLMKQLSRGSIETLDVSQNFLRGSIHELAKIPDTIYPELKQLKLSYCFESALRDCEALGRNDILGLRYLIQENKLPGLEKLEICIKQQDALEKLLMSCERMRNGKQCKISVMGYEVSEELKSKKYKCLNANVR